jgi:hypothetical protein
MMLLCHVITQGQLFTRTELLLLLRLHVMIAYNFETAL